MKFLTTAILLACIAPVSAETKKTESTKALKPAIDYSKRKFPTGFAHKKGFVISPYKPYNVLDVKHLKPGNLAYDPTTAILNPSTGKRDISTAKIFRIPQPRPQQQASASSTSR